jgi:hypothetical protein
VSTVREILDYLKESSGVWFSVKDINEHFGTRNAIKKLRSRNLAHPKLDERQAFVTKPYSRGNEAEGTSQSAIEAELTAKSPAL